MVRTEWFFFFLFFFLDLKSKSSIAVNGKCQKTYVNIVELSIIIYYLCCVNISY